MFGKTVHEEMIGPLSYQIKSPKRGRFTLWRGGCRIGKPQDNGDTWEFTAKTLKEAQEEMYESAKRELRRRVTNTENQLTVLREALNKAEQAF